MACCVLYDGRFPVKCSRDLNQGLSDPITGWGYYVDLLFEAELWLLGLNYGEFYPEQIGNLQHDATNRRRF